jgi:hypothetical protein
VSDYALKKLISFGYFRNSTWWRGHSAGSVEVGIKSGDPLRKIRSATVTVIVGVEGTRPLFDTPPDSIKYKIRALNKCGVRNIKFCFDRG